MLPSALGSSEKQPKAAFCLGIIIGIICHFGQVHQGDPQTAVGYALLNSLSFSRGCAHQSRRALAETHNRSCNEQNPKQTITLMKFSRRPPFSVTIWNTYEVGAVFFCANH